MDRRELFQAAAGVLTVGAVSLPAVAGESQRDQVEHAKAWLAGFREFDRIRDPLNGAINRGREVFRILSGLSGETHSPTVFYDGKAAILVISLRNSDRGGMNIFIGQDDKLLAERVFEGRAVDGVDFGLIVDQDEYRRIRDYATEWNRIAAIPRSS